jgi:hypothetical protein
MVNMAKALGAVLVYCLMFSGSVFADRMVLKSGKNLYGHIIDERDSLIRFIDRHDRPKKQLLRDVDSVIYDREEMQGRVKATYRRGIPKDWTGYFKLRHTDILDLDVIYVNDSTTELDLFFKNDVHVRILSQSQFQILHAPNGPKDELRIQLNWGGIIAEGQDAKAVSKIVSPFGVGVLRGAGRMAFQAHPRDSSIVMASLHGLVGVQEKLTDPGEFIVDTGSTMSFMRQDGIFKPSPIPEAEAKALAWQAENMGHYAMRPVAYPPVGYLPRAITGLGFLLFFYGSTLGVLDYVNHL